MLAAGLAGLSPLTSQPFAKAASGSPRDPAAIISAIYQQAIKSDYPTWLEPANRPKYLSQSLLALWAKADAKIGPDGKPLGPPDFDFDLTTDTNGLTLERFKVKLESQTADAASIAVTLGYRKPYVRPEGPSIVTYDFIREDGLWRVDNIHTAKWSVRDLLSQWLKDD